MKEGLAKSARYAIEDLLARLLLLGPLLLVEELEECRVEGLDGGEEGLISLIEDYAVPRTGRELRGGGTSTMPSRRLEFHGARAKASSREMSGRTRVPRL